MRLKLMGLNALTRQCQFIRYLILVSSLLFTAFSASAEDEIESLLDLWDYSDPVGSELLFLSIAEEAKLSTNPEYLPILITQLARTHSLRGHFELANEQLDQAKSLIAHRKTRAWVFLLLERGRVYNSAGDKRQAREFFEEAFRKAELLGDDYLAIDAAHMVAIAESLDQQMKWNLIALGIAESSRSPRAKKWLGSLYNNMGWTYFDQADYEKALSLFEKAVVFRQNQDNPRRLQIAQWALGKTLRKLGRTDEALEIQLALAQEKENSNESPDAFVIEEIAEIYYIKGSNLAPDYFARAHRLMSRDEWIKINEPERLARLKKLAVKD